MSKYQSLWDYVTASGRDALKLTFDEIGSIAGVPIDHSFLTCKKELVPYGYRVGKVSMKAQTVEFLKEKPDA